MNRPDGSNEGKGQGARKAILINEHLVVYGVPAIAVPIPLPVQVTATVSRGAGLRVLILPATGENPGKDTDSDRYDAVRRVLKSMGLSETENMIQIQCRDDLPGWSGLGSSAGFCVALTQALSGALPRPCSKEEINRIAYEGEKVFAANPSGIDNTVVTYAKPVFFIKGQALTLIEISTPFTLVIGDTGIATPTSETVGDVRRSHEAEPALYQHYFETCGRIANLAVLSIQHARIASLGPLMNDNHEVLVNMGVSCPELDRLVEAARNAGAMGAKLSGGGRGGNMIALAEPNQASEIEAALQQAGAVRTMITTVA